MTAIQTDPEVLRNILENMNDPQVLDCHPWVSHLFVKDIVERNQHLRTERPANQLIAALGELFSKMMPSTPPRRGKRLDTHWGEFGILAAQFFSPLQFGTPVPNSLRDAWGRIDQSILLHVYGCEQRQLSGSQVNAYKLVGDELEVAPVSTLSDWNKKGLQRLTNIILDRERFLARSSIHPTVSLNETEAVAPDPSDVRGRIRLSRQKKLLRLTLSMVLLLALGLGSLKASRVYQSGRQVYQDVVRLQELRQAPLEIETMDAAVSVLMGLQSDLSEFEREAIAFLWLSRRLDWVPVHGHDLSSASSLIEVAEHLSNASILAYQSARPLLNEFDTQDSALESADLTALLVDAQPQLEEARRELDQALAARESVDEVRVSPRLQELLVVQLDPLLHLADEGISLGIALPRILGAGSDGPKTYLLLVQNEDELRPTGGFITSIGNLVLHNGTVIKLDFESVDNDVQEDWSQPYPLAPWQLQEYMNSQVLILRDANWFTDFPTTALWVEYLYAYTHSHSVDGIIAFDQHFLVMLLAQLGPLNVEGAPYPLTAENVIEYMRQAKLPPAGEPVPLGWDRKDFIGAIAKAVLEEMTGEHDHDWRGLAGVLSRALAERHLLLQFDDPALAVLMAERGWDNAVRPDGGDYLMVADTNIGFNKTNAVVDVSLTYDVDLGDLDSPEGTLTLTHQNNARKNVPCALWNAGEIRGEDSYPINRCYWSYVRVYRQAGVELLEATPHAIPSAWMIFDENVPARVDMLEEEIPGVQGFGTLLVVPGGQTQSTSFRFALPQDVLSVEQGSNEFTYHLKVQKQPGTRENRLTLRIHLPGQARLKFTPAGGVLQDNHLLLETNLRTDVEINVIFTIP